MVIKTKTVAVVSFLGLKLNSLSLAPHAKTPIAELTAIGVLSIHLNKLGHKTLCSRHL